MSGDIISPKELKTSIPNWVKSFCATLVCISLFINSIGLNLMQINTALTNYVVKKIDGRSEESKRFEEKLSLLEREVKELKINSHKPKER